MIEVRIHGRGGQGNVVAAYLLATAAFETGRHCQAFPSFGAERRGAPVTAFVRIAERPIRRRCQVANPAFLIIQDAGLLHIPSTTDGLQPNGKILVNSPKTSDELTAEYGRPITTLPATALAQEILGRPVPNVALLAGFAALTGIIPTQALIAALAHRFTGEVLERNTRLIGAVGEMFQAGVWKEVAHA